MPFIPKSAVTSYNSAASINPTTQVNAVVIQSGGADIRYALGAPSAAGFVLLANAAPVLIPLTAPLFITGTANIQTGEWYADPT